MAVALSVLLMMTVYGAIDLIRKFSSSGQDQVERDQLGRSVLREIESDIRALVYRDPMPIVTPHAGTANATRIDDLDAIRHDEAGLADDGLVGDSQSIVLRSSRQHPRLRRDAAPGGEPSTSGTRWIAYAPVVGGQIRLLGTALETLPPEFGDGTKPLGHGLAQLELYGSRMGSGAPGRPLPGVKWAELLSREVVDVQFRYFDGDNWTTSWNSAKASGLPQALEVNVTIADAYKVGYRDSGDNEAIGGDRYRMVIVPQIATLRQGRGPSSKRSP